MNAKLRPLVRPLLLLVAFTLLPHIQLRPLWSTAFVSVLLLYRTWLEFTNRSMPMRWVLWLGQIAVMAAIWSHFHTFFGEDAAGTLLTLLIGLKTFELHAKRDFFIACILCLLVVMSYLLADQGLMITAFLMANVVLVVTLLYAVEAEQWTWTNWKPFVRPGLTLVLKALPLLVLTFLLFPRFSTGFGTGSSSVGRIGVSDNLQPGSVSKLIGSEEIMFRATFLSGEVPPQALLYWRGAVLDNVDGMNWTRDKSLESVDQVPTPPIKPEVEIYLEPGSDRFLFALEGTEMLGFPGDLLNRRVRVRDGRIFELNEPLQTRDRYVFESGSASREGPPSPRMILLNDEPSAEMRDFLRGFVGKPPEVVVRELLERFRSGGYVYSLEPPPAPNLDRFFFKTKEGFCEHYAGTLATILRRLKIPARVIVGYQGGTPTLLGNYLTIRGHDAHAWVEYYDFGGARWRRVDPTAQVAPARLSLGSENFMQAEDSLMASRWTSHYWSRLRLRSRALFDQIDATWTGFLLGFDLAWQRDMLSKVGMDGDLFRALPVFLILGLALFLAILYFFEAQRREPIAEDEKLYRKLQNILRRQGIVRAPFEGPLALLGKAEAKNPELAKAVEPILAPLIRARFGRDPLSAESIQQIKRDLRGLGRLKG